MRHQRRKQALLILQEFPDGVPLYALHRMLCARFGYTNDVTEVRRIAASLPTVYIDRYTVYRGRDEPVYIAVPIPPDAPKPAHKGKPWMHV